MQKEDGYHLYWEGELLGVYEDLRAVADELIRTVIPAMEEKKNERTDSENTGEAVHAD